MLDDVGGHEHGVAEEAVVAEVLVGDLLLLFLIGGAAFQPAERRDHGEQKVQFGSLADVGLAVDGAFFRVEAGAHPVHHHVAHVLGQLGGVGVVAGKGVPVGHEEEGFMVVLHVYPVLEGAEIVADMQRAGGAHARNGAVVRRHGVLLNVVW